MSNNNEYRTLPHNLEAEQALLGAVLVNNEALAAVAVIVKPEHFFEGIHARIFETSSKLIGEGKTVSPVTLIHLFANDETLAEIGGQTFLARLASAATTIINAPEYARIIRDTAEQRAVIFGCNQLIDIAVNPSAGVDFHQKVAEKISDFSGIIEGNTSKRKTAFTADEAGTAVLEQMTTIWQGGTDINCTQTGLKALDDQLGGGMRRGEFAILAARPGMGKTALGLQIASNVAESGGGVAYFSLEMQATSLMQRLLSARLWTPERSVEYARLGSVKISEAEFERTVQENDNVRGWPLIIEDSTGLTPVEIEALARVFASKFERIGKSLDLVIVDHLHKCRCPGTQGRVAEYSEVSGRLAEIGKRLDCPVLALAQLNRAVESRDDKKPTLADLRESGSIEQDADVVLFVYRESYYTARQLERCKSLDQRVDAEADLERCKNDLEVIVGKQRNGPTGTVKLWCDMASNVVLNLPDIEPDRSNAA